MMILYLVFPIPTTHMDIPAGHTGRSVLIINVTLVCLAEIWGGDTRPLSCSGSLQCSGGKRNAQESNVGG